MFKENKYTKWYYNIIQKSKSRKLTGYSESHHIIPRSLGGSDNEENRAALTAKEHFLVHLLLTKMLEGESRVKMLYAFSMMRYVENPNQERKKISSKLFEKTKNETSNARREMAKGNKNPFYGKKHDSETITIMKKKRKERYESGFIEGMMGKKHSDEAKKKVSDGVKEHFESLSKEERSKIYSTPKNKYKTCEKCEKEINPSNFEKHVLKCVHGKSKVWFHNPNTNHSLFSYKDEAPAGYIRGRGKLSKNKK